MRQLHATSVNIEGQGVLIRGQSGSGKSDLALRLIDVGARLIADDQTKISLDNQKVLLNVAPQIAGKVEIRGFGISELPYDKNVRLVLIVDLRQKDKVERMPENQTEDVLGMDIPILQVHAFESSTVAKIHAVIQGLKK